MSRHTASCIIHQISVSHQILWTFIFHTDDLIFEPYAETHIQILTSKVMARGPIWPSLSLSSTLVSSRSLELFACLDLASIHTLGVLDDASSSSIAS